MLLAILLAALLLRIYHLETKSIWLDEAIEIGIAKSNTVDQVVESSLLDRNLPLHHLLLHYWIWLFGDSEFSVRLPSALFNLFSVALMYKVGSMLFSKETGLMSSLLLALSGYQLHYAQEARPYSMMVFLVLLSFYFFLRLFEGKDYRILGGYVLSTTLLIYSHIFGLFFVAAQALFTLGFYYSFGRAREQAPRFRTWALAGGALAVVCVPLFFYLAYQLTQPFVYGASNWIPKPGLKEAYSDFVAYGGAPGATNSPAVFSLLLFFALISVVALLKSQGERPKLYVLSLWLVVPIVLPFLLSQLVTPVSVPRYSIGVLPALYLLASEGIRALSSAGDVLPHRQTVPLVAIAVVGFFSLSVLYDNYTTHFEPWRETVSYVETHAEPGDLLLISQMYAIAPYDYYARREDLEEVPLDLNRTKEISSEVRGSDRIWLVLGDNEIEDDNTKQLKEALEEASFEVADHKLFQERVIRKTEVTLFEKR